MSLVVLKRKSQTKYSKISSKQGDFSLNNPRRVASHSNQTQTQTPMKGNVPRGHGSCCNHYPVVINESQYKNYDMHTREFNGDKANPGISVKNNNGSIASRHKWLKRGYPYYIVKDTAATSYEDYLRKKSGQASAQNYGETAAEPCGGQQCDSKKTGADPNIVKNVQTLDYSEYLRTKFLNKKCLPTPKSKAHYPVPVNGPCSSGGDSNSSNTETGNCG